MTSIALGDVLGLYDQGQGHWAIVNLREGTVPYGTKLATIKFKDHWWWKLWNDQDPTTIGDTIYVPTDWCSEAGTVAMFYVAHHELVHVKQFKKLQRWLGKHLGTCLWLVLYALFPLPAGLSWFRYAMEREAYLEDVKLGVDPELIVRSLGSKAYLWCWPKRWARAWFAAHR